jgi:hypothetical protein
VNRRELGDWQTPLELAREIVAGLREPRAVLEPTCGRGAFLQAAAERWPRAKLFGFDLNDEHLRAVPVRAKLTRANFFDVDWSTLRLPEPLLILGNPPWVLSGPNLPAKTNFKRLKGLDAITGKATFDVAEWMLLRLLDAFRGRDFQMAMLVKSSVARRVAERHGPERITPVNAAKHFGVAANAAVYVASSQPSTACLVDGTVVSDPRGYRATQHLAGRCEPEWRSGIKHDCAGVLEGDPPVEDTVLFPLLKSSDLANGRAPSRKVLVTQRSLSDDPAALKRTAPRAWAWLQKHKRRLNARKSSIYEGRPPFSIFGVGDYTFAPWKVAISGLYKRLSFALVGPTHGKPTLLDDTCYFLPFQTEPQAQAALRALQSAPAQAFFEARIFWDAKRPITKAVLQQLDLGRVAPAPCAPPSIPAPSTP